MGAAAGDAGLCAALGDVLAGTGAAALAVVLAPGLDFGLGLAAGFFAGALGLAAFLTAVAALFGLAGAAFFAAGAALFAAGAAFFAAGAAFFAAGVAFFAAVFLLAGLWAVVLVT
jgi:hypothetical protein